MQHTFTYDNQKRLLSTTHQINSNDPVVINKQAYDELDRLKRKELHCLGTNGLQEVNYNYNIRGWLTNINDVSALGNVMFAMELGYTTGTNPQYNAEKPEISDFIVFRASAKNYKNHRFFIFRDGNIATMQWNTNQFGANTYQFDYDGTNRLTEAVFTGTGQHNTSYSYDKNGNIETLTRQGQLGGGQSWDYIDSLTYTYQGNQLQSVNDIDDTGEPGIKFQINGFSDFGTFATTEFTYDANGNVTQDLNKSILLTEYYHLNLPKRIKIFDEFVNDILYLYDANGTKLQKATRMDYVATHTTDYCGNFVYVDGQLAYILTPEGRVIVDGSSFEYQYFLKDHLGNTRVTFNENGNIIQEDSYYPFGMAMAGLSDASGQDLPNKLLYNGKELQDEFGLEWYDYGNRYYMPDLGRWTTPDCLAEWYYDFTPYAYVGNNPISFIDPDGNFRTRFGAWWHKLWNGGDGIGQDKGGEYFVYTDDSFVDDEGVFNVTSTRVFDKNGRSEGKDMEVEAAKEALITQMNFQHSMEEMGIEVYFTDNRTEAISSMLQIPSMVVMPNVLKGTTGVVNAAKQGGRIKAGSLKELKSLIKQLSKPGSELTKKELRQLTKLVEKYGGKVRKDLNPVKGRINKPHVQVEGLGKSIESRHVWLKSGVN